MQGQNINNGIIKIHIGEGKDINLEIPMMSYAPSQQIQTSREEPIDEKQETKSEDKIRRSLVKRHFVIERVEFGEETKIENKTLYIREGIAEDAKAVSDIVKDVKIEIIGPDKYNTYSETIMDVQPIATKEVGSVLGSGATRVLDGVVMMVTGTDENGVQIGEFGSSEGILEDFYKD